MQQDTLRGGQRVVTRSKLGLHGLCFVLALAVPAGAQTDTQRAAARSAAQAGDKAFKEQRYEEAAMYFARAETIMHAPTLLLFLARSQAKLGQYVEARETYIKILREELAPDAPSAYVAAKRSAGEELPAVEQQIATITLDVPNVPIDSLRITVDGELVPSAVVGVPYPIDPGQHELAARAAGYEPAATRVNLGPGQTRELTLELTRASPAIPAPPLASPAAQTSPRREPDAGLDAGSASSTVNGMAIGGYLGLGVGVLGVGLGTLFAVEHVQALNDANDTWARCLEQSESGGCEDAALERRTRDLDDEAATKGTQAWVAYGVGAAGLATGVALLALSRSDGPNAARITPYVTADAFGVAGQF